MYVYIYIYIYTYIRVYIYIYIYKRMRHGLRTRRVREVSREGEDARPRKDNNSNKCINNDDDINDIKYTMILIRYSIILIMIT